MWTFFPWNKVKQILVLIDLGIKLTEKFGVRRVWN